MKRVPVLLISLLMVLGACSRDGEPASDETVITAAVESCDTGEASPAERPEFGLGSVLIKTDDGSRLVKVEVAQTDVQRQFGLMFEHSLPEDSGMVFIFFEDNEGGFYMRNTLLPLSIAYFDVDGKIVRIVDMDPCEEDSTLYDPGAPYRGALEVNQGQFDEWGVEEGDQINVVPSHDSGM